MNVPDFSVTRVVSSQSTHSSKLTARSDWCRLAGAPGSCRGSPTARTVVRADVRERWRGAGRAASGPQPSCSARVRQPASSVAKSSRSCLLVRVSSSASVSAAGRSTPGGVEPLGDLLVTLGELAQHPGRDSGDLGGVVVHRPPLDPEALRELAAHRRLEQDADGALRPIQRGAVERGPAAVDPTGSVGDQHMPVQVRVTEA